MLASVVSVLAPETPAMFLIIIVVVFLTLVLMYNRNYGYWKKRNVPYLQPRFPLGNIPNPFTIKEKSGHLVNRFYETMRIRGWKHGGLYIFNIPVYMVVDLEYVKNILAKDFEYFTDRGIFYDEKNDPISANVLHLGGQKWKNMRSLLNPLFTSCKVKTMLPLVSKSVEILMSKLEDGTSMDTYELVSRYTISNIASCIFGLECNMFEEKNASFRIYGEKMIKQPKYRIFSMLVASIFPRLGQLSGLRVFPSDCANFFTKLVEDCISYRKENGYKRDDLIQLIIDLKDALTIEQVTAQCVMLFLAGYETSSSALTFALYEMAKNQEIQDRAREEIRGVLDNHEQKITYEALQDFKYLDQIFEETERKYPSGLYLTRKCVKDYKVPDEDVIIEKGTIVLIPSAGIHYDEEYYPDPHKFDPDRFSKDNKKSRHVYTHLPFGGGPRTCIGKRFAFLQIKIALAALLKDHRFTVSDDTKEPLELRVDSITVTPANPVWLNVHKL